MHSAAIYAYRQSPRRARARAGRAEQRRGAQRVVQARLQVLELLRAADEVDAELARGRAGALLEREAHAEHGRADAPALLRRDHVVEAPRERDEARRRQARGRELRAQRVRARREGGLERRGLGRREALVLEEGAQRGRRRAAAAAVDDGGLQRARGRGRKRRRQRGCRYERGARAGEGRVRGGPERAQRGARLVRQLPERARAEGVELDGGSQLDPRGLVADAVFDEKSASTCDSGLKLHGWSPHRGL